MSRNRIGFLYVGTTLLSVAMAYALFMWGRQGLFWDAQAYYDLAATIAKEGLFNYSSKIRPYGYPLFVSLAWLFPNHFPSTVRFVIFNLQLMIFLGTSLYMSRLFQGRKFAFAVYAVCALNPFLQVYTTEILSDLLSAALVSLAIVFSVRVNHKQRGTNGYAFLSFLAAGFATMVRPGNLPIFLAVAFVWMIRGIIFRAHSLRVLFFIVMGLVLPFTPQLLNNYRAFNQLQPLIVQAAYSDQLNYGMKFLKYASIVIPGEARAFGYTNPFLPPNVSSIQSFILQKPLGFVLTEGLHVFTFFDKDFVFPFVVDLHPWYRWPLSLMNYVFLFVAGSGIVGWLRQTRRLRRLDRNTLVLGGFLVGAIAYVPLHVFTAIEERFSLPEYILLCPFFVLGLSKTVN